MLLDSENIIHYISFFNVTSLAPLVKFYRHNSLGLFLFSIQPLPKEYERSALVTMLLLIGFLLP